MKRMILAALTLAISSMATGCIFVADDSQGHLHASWDVSLNGAPVGSCAEVGAAKVEILATLEGTQMGTADRFPCDNFDGTTFGLDEGPYIVVVSILDSANAAIADYPPESTDVFADETTDLGLYTFDFQQ